MNKIFTLLLFCLALSFSKSAVAPSGVYIMLSEDYEFEQILIFKDNFEVQVFEKNHYRGNEENSNDLLESYKMYWKVQDDRLCFPLKTYPSENLDERYCQDYHIDESHLIFFEPGRGDEIEEIKFIKISN